MMSRISGPIPSHNPYHTPRSVHSSRSMRIENGVRCANRVGGSLNALDLLQWQSNISPFENSNISQTAAAGMDNSFDTRTGNFPTSNSSKNFIRENIRRLRRMQPTPPQKRIPYTACFVPVAQSYRAGFCNYPIASPQPPRPHTGTPHCTPQASQDYDESQTKNDNTNRKCESRELESVGYEFQRHNDQHWPVTQDQSGTQLVDRPTSPIRQSRSSRESIGVQYDKSYDLSESAHEKSTQSKGIQALSEPYEKTDPVSTEFNRRPQQSKRNRGRSPTRAGSHRRARPASAGPVGRHDFMRAHAKTIDGDWNLQVLSTIPLPAVRRTPRPERLSVPKASVAKSVHLIRRDINYIRANAHMATVAPLRASRVHSVATSRASTPRTKDESGQDLALRAASGSGVDALKFTGPQRKLPLGSLPTYLIKRRQEQRAAEVRAAAAEPDPDQPPGHHKMSDSERKETLDLLQKAHRELSDEWSRLPIRSDTVRIRTRKDELERRLSDLEQAINIFNKPKVFIKPE